MRKEIIECIDINWPEDEVDEIIERLRGVKRKYPEAICLRIERDDHRQGRFELVINRLETPEEERERIKAAKRIRGKSQ